MSKQSTKMYDNLVLNSFMRQTKQKHSQGPKKDTIYCSFKQRVLWIYLQTIKMVTRLEHLS